MLPAITPSARGANGARPLHLAVLALAGLGLLPAVSAQEQTGAPDPSGVTTAGQDAPQNQGEPTTGDRRTRRLTRERRTRRDDGDLGDDRLSRISAGLGYGRFAINARELGQRDHDDAVVLHFDAEFWLNRHVGFGLNSELVGTGDDMFAGQQVESGIGPRAADAQITASDLALYFAWDPLGGNRFRLPLLIGPWFSGTSIDYDRARIDYEFFTAGIRFAVRPEWKLLDRQKVDLVAFAGASYAIGFTTINEDLIGSDETYDSESQQFRAEGGLRVDLRGVSLGLQYVYSNTGINLSDVENGRRVPEIDYDVNMFFFTVGGRF